MKRPALAGAVCAILLTSASAAVAASAQYEMATLPGTPTTNAGYFRINTQTGQTVVAWGANTQFNPVIDSTPVPQGDYQIQATAWVSVDGKVSWNVFRLDINSGRSWTGLGGGNAPITWTEITPPK